MRFLSNPRINKNCHSSLEFSSDAQMFIVANINCLNEVQSMFNKAFDQEDEMLDYYKDMVNEQLFKYVYEGSEFMMNA